MACETDSELVRARIASQVGHRIEGLPLSSWHVRTMGLVGTATFFDAFDALTIAFVLPALSGPWHLTPRQIGLTIASGYAGQLIGAFALGAVSDRIGRRGTLIWAVGFMSVLSLACAAAWALPVLLICRLLQGIGLGGEVPVAAIYVNELSPARLRGRLILLFQSLFGAGVALTAILALWIIPHLGWRSMFMLGALPMLLLPFYLRLPESPRWLAGAGRVRQAQRELQRIEAAIGPAHNLPTPPPESASIASSSARPSFLSLLHGVYLSRTLSLWLMVFCTSAVGYGLLTWLPSLYRTVFHLSVSQSLTYSLANSFTSPMGSLLGALLIDRIGRRVCFIASFLGAALPLLVLWRIADRMTPLEVMTLTATACLFISVLLAGIYVYAPEIYPTHLRGRGVGAGTACYRLAAIVSPVVIGWLLQGTGVSAVFLFLGVVSLVGALIVMRFAIEARGRPLEELAA